MLFVVVGVSVMTHSYVEEPFRRWSKNIVADRVSREMHGARSNSYSG
jgi:peptidoglycan/LPS O-acetylase OafA/YrhL